MLWLNGNLRDENDAPIAVSSAGNLLGWGVFTTIGVWNARPFALDLHLQRLRHDAKIAHIEYSIADETLRQAVRETIDANHVSRGIARLTVSRRGDGRWNKADGSDVCVLAQNMATKNRVNDLRVNDLRVALSPFVLNSRSAVGGIKTTSYLEHQLAYLDAQNRGCDEAILCNERGEIGEGARANVFWVRDGTLKTPWLQSGCLPGIARHLILGWARESAIPTREESGDLDELLQADEVFFTSSSAGIRGVREVLREIGSARNIVFPSAKPVTSQLQKRWQNEVEAA